MKGLGKGDKAKVPGATTDRGLNSAEGYSHSTMLRKETKAQQPGKLKRSKVSSDRGSFKNIG